MPVKVLPNLLFRSITSLYAECMQGKQAMTGIQIVRLHHDIGLLNDWPKHTVINNISNRIIM